MRLKHNLSCRDFLEFQRVFKVRGGHEVDSMERILGINGLL